MKASLLKSILRRPTKLSSESILTQTVVNVVWVTKEVVPFAVFVNRYGTEKLLIFSRNFEKNKNTVVKTILIKRGKRNRIFLHISAMAVLLIGIFISPYISDTELFSKTDPLLTFAQEDADTSVLAAEDVFDTKKSEKPRNEVISYTVQKGDTISLIAKKFGVSEDTVRWENSISNDTITVGDQLRILPVTGMAHKVANGDTVYTIAKKYGTNPQGIVDFPFNDFANPQTFSLVEGQIVIVPDGVKPEEKPRYTPVAPRYIATNGNEPIQGTGFAWPIHGTVNQYYSWYHKAVDLGAPVGTPVLAAQDGRVAEAYSSGWNGGYGTHIIIAGNNGYSTLYGHMSSLNVSAGDTVSAGKTVVGWVGMTGRTTGPHLHFEIRNSGGLYNPLSFLQ